MRDILPDVNRWVTNNKTVAIGTVVQTWGSAPRSVGSKMAMTADGQITGSVSGGCVESAVYAAGEEVLASGVPQLLHFGVADEIAWEVGLACGGTIEVFVERLSPQLLECWNRASVSESAVCTTSVLQPESPIRGSQLVVGSDGAALLSGLPLPMALRTAADQALATGRSQRSSVPSELGTLDIFCDVQLPSQVLIMIGAGHIAVVLNDLARRVGFQTVIIDPRGAFATRDRLPHASAVYAEWPDLVLPGLTLTTGTAFAALTHDPKIDDAALLMALRSPAFYIGALGSAKTHAERLERLQIAGADPASLASIHAPIGMDIGAGSPEEIAVSILAEIIKARHTKGLRTS